ncbi:hypothetical protein AAY473_004885, partial [Plecturocebus cupreus]
MLLWSLSEFESFETVVLERFCDTLCESNSLSVAQPECSGMIRETMQPRPPQAQVILPPQPPEDGVLPCCPAGLKLLVSSDLPISASQSAGITGGQSRERVGCRGSAWVVAGARGLSRERVGCRGSGFLMKGCVRPLLLPERVPDERGFVTQAIQAILLPQPPKQLGLQGHANMPSYFILVTCACQILHTVVVV